MANADDLFAQSQADSLFAQSQKEANPAAPPPDRGALKYVDAVSDALPSTGALTGGVVGGSLGGPLGLIGGGAAGYPAGEFLKRLLDRATSRPGSVPDVTPGYVAKKSLTGAEEAMGAEIGGQYFKAAAKSLGRATPLAEQLGDKPTAFAPLSKQGLDFVRSQMEPGSDIIMAPPKSELAQVGGKYATGSVDAARMRGSQALKRGGTSAADDVALFERGQKASKNLLPKVDKAMAQNVDRLADASGNAIDTIAEKLPPRLMDPTAVESRPWDQHTTIDPVFGPSEPPGGDVLNSAFRNPETQNSIIRDRGAMGALAEVKKPGLENKVLGGVRGRGLSDVAESWRSGLRGPAAADERAIDADTLLGLARSIEKQRGGIAQKSPDRGTLSRKLYEDLQQKVVGPQSRMFGLRAETPEDAILGDSRRQMELESARRGLSAVDPKAREAAMEGVQRSPFFDKLAKETDPRLAGGEMEAIRRWLLGSDRE